MAYSASLSTEELRLQTDSKGLATICTYYMASARAESQSYCCSPSKSAGTDLQAFRHLTTKISVALFPFPMAGCYHTVLHSGVRKAGNLVPSWQGRRHFPTCLWLWIFLWFWEGFYCLFMVGGGREERRKKCFTLWHFLKSLCSFYFLRFSIASTGSGWG